MPTLHKFKLLATQCAVAAGSPTRSPTTSPVIHLRRRKTLRMFLARTSSDPHRRRFHPPPLDPPASDAARVRHKLKDLFVSSPPPPIPDDGAKICRDEEQQPRQIEQDGILPASSIGVRFRAGSPFRRGGASALRPVSSAFRYRLLRRAWRPMLVTIPE